MDRIPDIIFLPATADRPAEPAPYLMTEEETVRMLRLDGVKDPYDALLYYRRQGRLKATQVGRFVRFQLPDVIDFLKVTQEANPR